MSTSARSRFVSLSTAVGSSQSILRTTPTEFRLAICGRRAVSIAGCAIVAPFSIAFLVSVGIGRGSSLSQALIEALLSNVVRCSVLVLAAFTVLRRRFTEPSSLAIVLLVYAVSGAVRPPTVAWIGSIFGTASAGFDLGRIAQASIGSIVLLCLAAFIVDSNDRWHSSRNALREATRQLVDVRDSRHTVIDREQTLLMTRVHRPAGKYLDQTRRNILATLESQSIDTGSLASVRRQIDALVDQCVRPLSRLASSPSQIPFAAPTPLHAATDNSWWIRLRTTAWTRRAFHPVAMTAVVAFALPLNVNLNGPAIGVSATAMQMALTYFTLSVARQMWPYQRIAQFGFGIRSVGVVGTYALCGFVALAGYSITWNLWHPSAPNDSFWIGVGVLIFVFECTAIAIVSHELTERQSAIAELRSQQDALQFEVAHLNSELEAIRTQSAQQLHGTVQSRLVSMVLLLEKAISTYTAPADEPHRRSSLEGVAQALGNISVDAVFESQSYETADEFLTAIHRIGSQWDGLVVVRLHCESATVDAIVAAHSAASAVVALVQELITNAAKHGRASTIEIYLSTSSNSLSVVAVDDGALSNLNSWSSAGLSSFVPMTRSLTIEPAPRQGTVVSAEFALSTSAEVVDLSASAEQTKHLRLS